MNEYIFSSSRTPEVNKITETVKKNIMSINEAYDQLTKFEGISVKLSFSIKTPDCTQSLRAQLLSTDRLLNEDRIFRGAALELLRKNKKYFFYPMPNDKKYFALEAGGDNWEDIVAFVKEYYNQWRQTSK